MSTKPLEELLDELLSGRISPLEAGNFVTLIDEPANRQQLERLLEDRFHNDEYTVKPDALRQLQVKALLLEKIAAAEPAAVRMAEPSAAPVKKQRRILSVQRVAAAAAVLFVLTGAAWMLLHNIKIKVSVALLTRQQRFKNDVRPGVDKAILQLADGSEISLDGAANGSLAVQGNARVVKKDGNLFYETTDNTGRKPGTAGNSGTPGNPSALYNTVSTPAAAQYHLTLADGTQVWLDALSGIRFPTSFTGSFREVEVTGQAYLEVAKNAAKPFRVRVKDQEIEVLGTAFNINAYDNELSVRTTLSEGAVKVTAAGQSLLLKPGQQARLDAGTALKLETSPDMAATLAWKNGLFSYNGADIGAIMRQAARWYGVEVVYQDKPTEEFVGEIPREVPLSKLLELLEETKQVHFIIEGKKVTVMK